VTFGGHAGRVQMMFARDSKREEEVREGWEAVSYGRPRSD
jgi:hypothetical protein